MVIRMIMKGQKISDRYQIIKSIGEGGMANVYLAYDTILDRNVAIKVLRGDLANDEKFVRRFQREALAASSLSNPNIVEVYDVGEDNGEYYIVMEYIEGKHLKQLIKKRGKLTVPEAVDIVMQITEGLSVAHDAYIIHRDIKPQNIMILENGLVKITDFGIAMAMNGTQLTQTNSVMGSVHYLPPEQANGKGATLQSDIYSIGILFYELLTGKLPFKGENAVEIALKHLKEPLPSIKEEIPNLPQSVENIIIKATAKNPKNRYADAREMHEDLKTCLDPSRVNEPKIKLKYQEVSDDTKVIKAIKENKNNQNDDAIAKKITGDDLKKQNKILIILASIFTGLVLVVSLVFILIMVTTKTGTLLVPDVSNKTVTEAVKILQDAGFNVTDEQDGVSSKEIEVGRVVKTSPAAGSKRKKKSAIKLFVSTGDATIAIEDYTGKNYLEVKGALEARGLVVNIENEVVDDDSEFQNDQIVKQSVEPGGSLKKGESITLYVASVGIPYPDFTDGSYTISDVEDFCEEHNLNCNLVEVPTDDGEIGKIISQSREAGSPIKSGASFKVRYYVKNTGIDEEETCTEEDRELGNC
jgi:serine/threonine-protein kinase